VDDVRLAHIFEPDRAIRFPGLLERRPIHHADAERRPAIRAVHRAALPNGVGVPPAGNLLDMTLGRVRGAMIRSPRRERPIRTLSQDERGQDHDECTHANPPSQSTSHLFLRCVAKKTSIANSARWASPPWKPWPAPGNVISCASTPAARNRST